MESYSIAGGEHEHDTHIACIMLVGDPAQRGDRVSKVERERERMGKYE